MRFPTRRTARSEAAATYAAVVADRVLWVATSGPEPLVLEPATGGAALAPDDLDDGQPGHHGSRFDLARLAPDTDHVLRTARGRPVAGPSVGPVAAGAAYALTRGEDHTLHVVRRPVPAGPTLRAAQLQGDRVQLSLDAAGDTALQLLDGDRVVTTWDVDPDGHVTLTADDLPDPASGADGVDGVDGASGRTLHLQVAGHPVRRRANHLADPGAGVPLPALHPAGAPGPRARLRWSPDATLVLRLSGPAG